MKTLRILFGVIPLFLAHLASGAGVTIITHGFQPLDAYPKWVDYMGAAIAKRAGSSTAVVKIDFKIGSTTRELQAGSFPDSSSGAEIVIKVFWHEVAGLGFDSVDTTDIATQLIPYLTDILSWNGTTTLPFAQMPIHLIGHSRGGSVVSEISRLLGQRGIWVHQMTTLDPHPVGPLHVPSGSDAPVNNVWETVLFADNYYERVFQTFPDGEEINGADNANLTFRLPGGYGDGAGPANHSDVHLWYHGTVDTGAGAYDGQEYVTGTMRNAWYLPDEYAGQKAGFYYSRLGGGHWALDGFLFGYNDGGHNILPDTRVNVGRNANEWPSLISLIQNASGSIQAGNAFPVQFIYQSYDSGASVTLYLDTDQNPYNGNETALTLPAINPQPSTARTTKVIAVNGTVPAPTAPDFYYVYGKITNPFGTRYLYAADKVRVVTGATVAAATIASVSPSTLPPSSSTQLISIYGSNFKASGDLNASTLIFRDPANIAYVRTPTFVSSSQLQYNIVVQSAVGTWSVTVTNAGQAASNLKTFLVETPPPNTGSLTVSLSPAGAVSAGAQWRVDGGSYRNTGDTATGLTPGSHTVSFKAVSGYTTPADKSVSITSGANTTDFGTYTVVTPSTYTLTINSDHGQVYRNPNKSTFSPGESIRLSANNDSGWHFDHWSGDASGSTSPIDVVMDRDKTVTANWASGDASLVTITMTLQPAGVVAAGARWRIDGGSWQNSGEPLTGQFLGDHYLEFADPPGWFRPAAFSAAFVRGATNLTGIYTQDATLGALIVTLTPPDAVTAGAKWRVNGGAQQNSGASVPLAPGSGYNITFDSASGWSAPGNQPITIQPGQTTVVIGNYSPPAGIPTIYSINPSVAAVSGGNYATIKGANFIAPATVFFGGIASTSALVNSSTEIVAAIPPSTTYGSVEVVVHAAGGSATNASGFAYGFPRGTNMSLAGSIGGHVDAVAVQGNYAYVGEGSSLVILNVSNPANPFPVGRLALPGRVWDVALHSAAGRTYACVANDDAGLQIVDVTSPALPLLKGYYQTPGNSRGISILGGIAYVADGYSLQVFSLSSPLAPTLLGSVAVGGFANDIVLKASANGLLAYLSTGGSGLQIVDVNDPSNPVARGQASFGHYTYSIAVSGNRAYLATQSYLRIVDISNPDAPINLGQELSAVANVVYSVGSSLYVGKSAGLMVFNVSGGTFQHSGSASSPSVIGANMLVVDGWAYVCAGDNGLLIFSVGNPSAPSLQSTFAQNSGAFIALDLSGQYAFVAAGNPGLKVFNVSNPSLPQKVGEFLPAAGARSTLVANNRAYVQSGDTSASILDISTPSSPSLLGTIPSSQMKTWDMGWFGSFLLASGQDGANYHTELAVIDVSNPAAPSIHGKLDWTSGTDPAKVLVNNGVKACVAIANIGEVRIVSLAQSSTPTQIGSIPQMGNVGSLAMTDDGNTLYIGDEYPLYCLRIFDISNPSNPTLLNSNYIGDSVLGIALTDSVAYLAACGRVLAIDVASPSSPSVIRSYKTPSCAWEIRVVGENCYVACRDAGLVILNITDRQSPEVFITNPTFSPVATNLTGTIILGGGASDDKGVTRITWSNSRGGGGDATGTESWFVNSIALQPGTNVLTVTAFDHAGNNTTDTLTVIYQTPKQNQTITFPAIANRTFGEAPVMLVAAASSSLPVSFSIVSGPASLSNNVLSLLGAGAMTVQASQPGNDFFNPAPPTNVSFNVAKADQGIAFAALPDKSAGDPPFALDATASSGLPVSFDIVSGPAVLDTNVVTVLGGGIVNVRAWQPGNSNYNAAADVLRSFTVAKVPQFITFGALSRQVLGDAPFPLLATASSGLPVNMSVLSGPAVVSGNILTITGAGLVVLRASQPGNATYAPAANVDQVLRAAPGNNVITDAQQLGNGMFTLRFYGEPGTNYVVLASADLVNWVPVATNQISGLGYLEFTDAVATNYRRRFYRVVTFDPEFVVATTAFVPAGNFMMGNGMASDEGDDAELPLHEVYVSAFYMDKHEVTKALWNEVYIWATNHGYVFENGALGKANDHPVHTVTWYDAVKWCNARSEKEGRVPAYYTTAILDVPYRTGQVAAFVKPNAGYRLPTEAEWEKAARGGAGGQRFPWGNSITHGQANYYSHADYAYDTSPTRNYHPMFGSGAAPYTSPAGSFAPNGYGLHDMAGNVWEWCWDWYSSTYYNSPSDDNPVGPASGSARVIRGGSWDGLAFHCRIAKRNSGASADRYFAIGFRCVVSAGQ